MTGVRPTPAPDLENELAKLANDAMASGADPRDTSEKLRTVIQHLRANPALAAQATNALADGVATPADISRKVYEHAIAPVGIHVEEPADLTEGTRAALPSYMQPAPTVGGALHNLATAPQRALKALKGAGKRVGSDLAYASQQIPGVELGERVAREHVQGETPDEAYKNVQGIADQAPDKALATVGMMAALGPVGPENPVLAGALYGGATQALDANPERTPMARGVRTAIGAAGGALLGKLGETAMTRLRAKATENYPAEAQLMKDEAAKANDENYGAALDAGAQREPTPIVQQLLGNQDFTKLAKRLQSSPSLRGLSTTDPRFINEMYKSLSDLEGGVRTGLSSLDPRNPNTKRIDLKDVKLLKKQLLAALEAPDVKPPITMDVPATAHTVPGTPGHEQAFGPIMEGTAGRAMGDQAQVAVDASGKAHVVSPRDVQGPAGPAFNLKAKQGRPTVTVEAPAMRVQTAPAQPMPAFMPEYRGAVDAARQAKAEGRAFDLGYDAVRAEARHVGHPPPRAVERKFSPDAIKRYVSSPDVSEPDQPRLVSDAERQRLVQGALAAVKKGRLLGRPTKILGTPIWPHLSPEMRVALPTMRATGAPDQSFADYLTKLGVLSTEAPFSR